MLASALASTSPINSSERVWYHLANGNKHYEANSYIVEAAATTVDQRWIGREITCRMLTLLLASSFKYLECNL
ncbi:unnamed protein product [Periconia digitata]|uniref:Uncharacterized protein n=1 Tax=Periconia digitata TaxID=1303443 RepID=A0A9W4XQY6_9PLEO|nr:unnamed protein product [Periconia digitata]